MALSIYDQTFLSSEQQQQVTKLTKSLESNPASLPEIHQAVEDIRATAGYSGGGEGNQYIKLDNPNEGIPDIPDFGGFAENAPKIPDLQNDFNWEGGSYQTEFDNMLSQVKSMVDDGFKYDSNTDEAFQAFKNQMRRMGNNAYQSDMAAASARTGGTQSSYGQAVASQSRNQYLQTATDAIPTFRNQALNEYKTELDSKMSLMQSYNSLNEQEYSKYKDEMDIALTQYETELNKYLNDINLAEKSYDYEMNQYQASLGKTRTEISDAWDRTQTLGYVSNQDASILGLEPGTLSEDARKAEQELDLYLDKQEADLISYKKELNAKIATERSQAKWELENLPQKTNDPEDEKLENVFNLTSGDRKEIRDFEQDFWNEMGDLRKGTVETLAEGSLVATVKKDKWDTYSEEEKSNKVNEELESRAERLMGDLQIARKGGNKKLEVITMQKLKVIYDSTWFINYANQEMKSSKLVFMEIYNDIMANDQAVEKSDGAIDNAINPTKTRQGTK